MKRGDIVAVCYDGKWGRRVRGEVLATRQCSRILVRFESYAESAIVEHWFKLCNRKTKYGGKRKYYGGYARVEHYPTEGVAEVWEEYYTVHPLEERTPRYKRKLSKILFEIRVSEERKLKDGSAAC